MKLCRDRPKKHVYRCVTRYTLQTPVYIHTQSESISSKMKGSADLTEPAGGSRAKDQADINVSPQTTDKRNPTGERQQSISNTSH